MKHSPLRIVCVAAFIACSPAHAAPKIPINFVGDWCAEPGAEKGAYALPSWTEDGYYATGIPLDQPIGVLL